MGLDIIAQASNNSREGLGEKNQQQINTSWVNLAQCLLGMKPSGIFLSFTLSGGQFLFFTWCHFPFGPTHRSKAAEHRGSADAHGPPLRYAKSLLLAAPSGQYKVGPQKNTAPQIHLPNPADLRYCRVAKDSHHGPRMNSLTICCLFGVNSQEGVPEDGGVELLEFSNIQNLLGNSICPWGRHGSRALSCETAGQLISEASPAVN